MISSLYKSLSGYLLSSDIALQLEAKLLPPIAHMDLYENQYDREGTEIAYKKPAVFFEFQDSEVLREEAFAVERIRFALHLESQNFASSAANSHNQEIALRPIYLLEALKEVMQHFSAQANYSKPMLLSYRLDKDGKNHPVHILSYETNYASRRC